MDFAISSRESFVGVCYSSQKLHIQYLTVNKSSFGLSLIESVERNHEVWCQRELN